MREWGWRVRERDRGTEEGREKERERVGHRQAVSVTAVASRVYQIKSDHLRCGREGPS